MQHENGLDACANVLSNVVFFDADQSPSGLLHVSVLPFWRVSGTRQHRAGGAACTRKAGGVRYAAKIQITISPDALSAVSNEEFRAAIEKLVASVEVATREALYRSVACRRPIMMPVVDLSLMEYGPVEYGRLPFRDMLFRRIFSRIRTATR